MENLRVVLASKSPRRKELLGELFSDFEIISKEVDESLNEGIPSVRGVELLAIRKGAAVAESLECADALIISSDTLVELDGVALGKPADKEDAYRMLRSLSGVSHNVHTGIAVSYKGRTVSATATTAVVFRELSDEEIWDYINSGEPMDKAGAYGIQGGAGKFVTEYRGEFDTVVGLSVSLTEKLIGLALSGEEI